MSDIPLPPEPDAPREQPKPKLWRLLNVDELDNLPPPEWIIDDHITNGFTVVYGPSGSYKTFLTLDWACSVAAGRNWMGRTVTAAPVVYVSGEGAAGLPQRVRAWKADRQATPRNLFTVTFPVSLLSPEHVHALEENVYQTQARLLIVDTLARSMSGGDENSAADVGRAIAALDGIRQRRNCAVVVVHHTGHDKTRMRGSTALFAASDTVVRVEADADLVEVGCDKQKDARPFAQWTLRARQIGDSVVLSTTGFGRGRPHMGVV